MKEYTPLQNFLYPNYMNSINHTEHNDKEHKGKISNSKTYLHKYCRHDSKDRSYRKFISSMNTLR